jgi:hypothetical protein
VPLGSDFDSSVPLQFCLLFVPASQEQKRFSVSPSWNSPLLGVEHIDGIDWMAGMTAYGAGALSLGKTGTSTGWILFVSFMIIVANVSGALTGEWKGSRPKTLLIMTAGIATLMTAIVVVGMAGASK